MITFPNVPAGADVVVSATLFTTFLKCPDQARGRLAGEYPRETPESFRGLLAHRVFARHLTTGPITREQFTQSCREEIGKSLNPKLVSLGLKPSRLENVVAEVGDLYERFKRFPTEGFQGAEIQIEVEPQPGVILKGVVDAVFDDGGGVRIVDWKTGRLGTAERQLDFYALLWVLARGEPPNHVEAASVATGERYEAVPTKDRLTTTAAEVAAAAAELRSGLAGAGELERRGGPWCRYCPLLDGCAEGRSAAGVVA